MGKQIQIPVEKFSIEGSLQIPEKAKALILFVHGSGSSRFSPRNMFVAESLNKSGFGTLLIDLLSENEDLNYETRFDISLLTKRVLLIIDWIKSQTELKKIPLGLFGASTGAAAALEASAIKKNEIYAVVSRGGRPDLALKFLEDVQSPTLLIVGGSDHGVISLNQSAFDVLQCVKKLEIVPHATHLFEEPGALEEVSKLAKEWFKRYLLPLSAL